MRALISLALLTGILQLQAHDTHLHFHPRLRAHNIIIPQSRSYSVTHEQPVQITDVKVGVVILQQVATTSITISLKNPLGRIQEAQFLLPVPDGAAVKGFTFHGASAEPTAQLLPKDEARRIYDSIVAKIKDPALLEFAGYNVIKSSVFPVPANGTQRVLLTYEQVLPADGSRIDYLLPRTEALDYKVPWDISVKIMSKSPVATIYSPSHEIEIVRPDQRQVSARVKAEGQTTPGAFRLSYLLASETMAASLFAYPDPKRGGGFFMLLAGLPVDTAKASMVKREVTLVIDRSGSMGGEKLEQSQEAARQVIEGLDDGDAFNIITYNESVDLFSRAPVVKDVETVKRARQFIKEIRPRGGTNIHDALVEALQQKPCEKMLPIVLFLTDGLPTIGNTSEKAILAVAVKGNPHNRRIFTFGVGLDVNTPLLQRCADETRAKATFVLPKEDVELKVGSVFRRLRGPVFSSLEIDVVDKDGESARHRVQDLAPSKLSDMFDGDQLILLGQYKKDEPLDFRLKGNFLGNEKTFKFRFELDDATTRNAFVPRLWASRKIGVLIDSIRQMGADVSPATNLAGHSPEMKELVDEIVRLSTEFGILTEYTSFLAREGTDLTQMNQVYRQATQNFIDRAMNSRVGAASVNQSMNLGNLRGQYNLNARNDFLDERLNRVQISNVQQVNDRAFFQRNGQWVDSRVVNNSRNTPPDRVVEVGTPEFNQLVETLTLQNRQGCVSLKGEILLEVNGATVLVK